MNFKMVIFTMVFTLSLTGFASRARAAYLKCETSPASDLKMHLKHEPRTVNPVLTLISGTQMTKYHVNLLSTEDSYLFTKDTYSVGLPVGGLVGSLIVSYKNYHMGRGGCGRAGCDPVSPKVQFANALLNLGGVEKKFVCQLW